MARVASQLQIVIEAHARRSRHLHRVSDRNGVEPAHPCPTDRPLTFGLLLAGTLVQAGLQADREPDTVVAAARLERYGLDVQVGVEVDLGQRPGRNLHPFAVRVATLAPHARRTLADALDPDHVLQKVTVGVLVARGVVRGVLVGVGQLAQPVEAHLPNPVGHLVLVLELGVEPHGVLARKVDVVTGFERGELVELQEKLPSVVRELDGHVVRVLGVELHPRQPPPRPPLLGRDAVLDGIVTDLADGVADNVVTVVVALREVQVAEQVGDVDVPLGEEVGRRVEVLGQREEQLLGIDAQFVAVFLDQLVRDVGRAIGVVFADFGRGRHGGWVYRVGFQQVGEARPAELQQQGRASTKQGFSSKATLRPSRASATGSGRYFGRGAVSVSGTVPAASGAAQPANVQPAIRALARQRYVFFG